MNVAQHWSDQFQILAGRSKGDVKAGGRVGFKPN